MPCINYAHRGASEYAPENTFSAFHLGVEMGADGIETDIQRTKDGVLVLFHDDTMKRVLNRPERISDFDLSDLLAMDFGAFKQNPKYFGERIVTLEDFLRYFGPKNLQFALELKQAGVEGEALAMVNRFGVRERVIFTSFNWQSLASLREADADIAIGFLTDTVGSDVLNRMQASRFSQICPRIDLLDASGVALARSYGFSVRPWGVKTAALMQKGLALGIDGMTVNFPDVLTAALQKHTNEALVMG